MQIASDRFQQPSRGPHFGGNYRVLVADDELVNRRVHMKYVEKYNHEQALDHFETNYAEDGQDALEKLDEAEAQGKPYDILITDNSMPRKKGTQLLQDIAQQKMRLFAAMISSDNVEKEAREAGAKAFHTKPASIHTIRDILKQFQGLLTCPLPASRPSLILPEETDVLGAQTALPPSTQNPFEHAFAWATPKNQSQEDP